jgi:hypothetical protein
VLSFSAGSRGVDRPSGAVAQLVAHLVRNEGVRGSSPLSSTMIASLEPWLEEVIASKLGCAKNFGQLLGLLIMCRLLWSAVSIKSQARPTIRQARGPGRPGLDRRRVEVR